VELDASSFTGEFRWFSPDVTCGEVLIIKIAAGSVFLF
jgi:hypothetical protein